MILVKTFAHTSEYTIQITQELKRKLYKPVLSLSIFSALNILTIFDGIEMLQIFLMQKVGNFDLGKEIDICIVFFACLCFLFSPFGLIRNKFMVNGAVRERKDLSMVPGPLEIIVTDLPFLVLHAIIWHKYEAAIFIAKNVVALVVGAVEFCKSRATQHEDKCAMLENKDTTLCECAQLCRKTKILHGSR
jgi:hypothetical protein